MRQACILILITLLINYLNLQKFIILTFNLSKNNRSGRQTMLKSNPKQSQQKQNKQLATSNPLLQRELEKFMQIYSERDEKKNYQILNLYTLSKQLFNQISNLIIFTQQISHSVALCSQYEKQKKRKEKEESQRQENFPDPNPNPIPNPINQILQNNVQIKQIPIYIIKDIKTQRRVIQANISSVANKLKVLVCKTLQRQSSLVEYNYSSFTTMLREQINQFKFAQTIQDMRKQFTEIKKIFTTVNAAEARMYRNHTNIFVLNQQGGFYVNFYVQRLLFFRNVPIPFNGNLLFVPIYLMKQPNLQNNKISYAMIDKKYIKQLNRNNENWQNFCIELVFKDTCHSTILHYYCAYYQKIYGNQICSLLRKIRCYVYFSLLFNYLDYVYGQSDYAQNKKSLKINITEQIYLQINSVRTLDRQIQTNPKLIEQFLRYFDQKNIVQRAEASRQQARVNLQTYLKCMLAKIKYNTTISEKYINIRPKYMYFHQKRLQI